MVAWDTFARLVFDRYLMVLSKIDLYSMDFNRFYYILFNCGDRGANACGQSNDMYDYFEFCLAVRVFIMDRQTFLGFRMEQKIRIVNNYRRTDFSDLYERGREHFE